DQEPAVQRLRVSRRLARDEAVRPVGDEHLREHVALLRVPGDDRRALVQQYCEAWNRARKRSDAVGGRAGRRIESAEPPHMRPSVPPPPAAIVSCHVEQPLRDDVWDRFLELRQRRPGGFDVIALIRPPDTAFGEDAGRWLDRVSYLGADVQLGLHTHWTSPT